MNAATLSSLALVVALGFVGVVTLGFVGAVAVAFVVAFVVWEGLR